MDRIPVVVVVGVLSGLLGAMGSDARAQDRATAFVGAHVIPVDGPEIENGTLVVQDGKIISVGGQGVARIPDRAEIIDARGMVIMPGLVDTHSHVGGISGADGSGPIQPGVRVLDSLNVMDSGFKRAVAGGITTANIMPGSGHLSSGQTVYAKMRIAEVPTTIDELLIRDADGAMMGGLKMANGTNSMRDAPFPGTRARSAFLIRKQFVKAMEYREKIEQAGDDTEKMPARDLHLETFVEVLNGERVVHFHTHRHDDIMTVLRLKEEFGFRVVLHHVSEGWKVAEEIAAAGVPVSAILVDSPGGKLEAKHLIYETGKALEDAGVVLAYHTDDWITDSRYFLRMPALGMRAGLSRETALKSVTLNGAEILDLGDRVGSLTVGKDADFVVLDGDPFSVYTKILETWVEGEKVFDRGDAEDFVYAVGGYGAGHDQRPYLCCYGQGAGHGQTGAQQ